MADYEKRSLLISRLRKLLRSSNDSSVNASSILEGAGEGRGALSAENETPSRPVV